MINAVSVRGEFVKLNEKVTLSGREYYICLFKTPNMGNSYDLVPVALDKSQFNSVTRDRQVYSIYGDLETASKVSEKNKITTFILPQTLAVSSYEDEVEYSKSGFKELYMVNNRATFVGTLISKGEKRKKQTFSGDRHLQELIFSLPSTKEYADRFIVHTTAWGKTVFATEEAEKFQDYMVEGRLKSRLRADKEYVFDVYIQSIIPFSM